MKKRLSLVLFTLLAVTAVAAEKADLSRLVFVGDSLTAGFQNFSLAADQQVNGYANLIATQAQVPIVLPLIAPPGIPSKLTLQSVSPLVIGPEPGTSIGRINPGVQPTNFAVPGHTLAEVLFRQPVFPPNLADPIDILTFVVLGIPPGPPLSQVERVEALALNPATRPTTIIAWAGNNDALFSVLIGNDALLTPPLAFGRLYDLFLTRLSATGAKIVAANIPDVTATPYLTSGDKLVAALAAAQNLPRAVVYAMLGIQPGDWLLPSGVIAVQQTLASGNPLPAICPPPIPALPPAPCLMHANQVANIQNAINAYNAIIALEASARDIPVVDINGLFKGIVQKGIVVNGRRLTNAPLGGLFSLDMVHPTNVGYAIIANEFIKTMNRNYATDIDAVSLSEVSKTDPLFVYVQK